MTYADRKKIRFVVLVGENEMNEGLLTVKDMVTGEQKKMQTEDLINAAKV